MPLFVVKHQHDAQTCPAGDPVMGPMLLQHVSAATAQGFGLNLHGQAVVDGAHTFFLIVDAPAQERVDEYMTPFTQVGSVEILPASTCEAVVDRAGC